MEESGLVVYLFTAVMKSLLMEGNSIREAANSKKIPALSANHITVSVSKQVSSCRAQSEHTLQSYPPRLRALPRTCCDLTQSGMEEDNTALSLSPSLPPSLSPSLPHSLSPSLPLSLTPSLPLSLTPSLPLSLSPSLPHSLSPSLPLSLSPSLPLSLTG